MIIKTETDSRLNEPEVIIRSKEITPEILKLKELISGFSDAGSISFYKDGAEIFLPVMSVLFFETVPGGIIAHTSDDMYKVKNKLYELENLLPNTFIRISKSAILNVMHIEAIDTAITSSRCVYFKNTYKQIYVSRSYYKNLKNKISLYRKEM